MKISRLLVTMGSVLSAGLLFSSAASISAQTGSVGGNRLANTEWRLTAFVSPRAETPVIATTTITLKFGADDRAGGSGGCNTYQSQYRIRRNTLSFGPIISTKRACLDQAATIQEQRYFRALEAVLSFRITGNRLTTNPGRGGTLTFVEYSPSTPSLPRYEDLTNPTAVLASFYDAVNMSEYDRAYGYWETPPGNLDDFARGYRETVHAQLIVQPPTKIEGAAGSSYAEVPTVIVALQRNGSKRIFAGCYVIRKRTLDTGDTEGGAWRIYKTRLSPAVASVSVSRLLLEACRN